MASSDATNENRRILIVDDNEAIHDDFRKILAPALGNSRGAELDDLASALLGDQAASTGSENDATYELAHALNGREALELVESSVERGEHFAMVFMDVRMPPGWDGIETLKRLWEHDAELQAVVCTAYADYNYQEIVERLGDSDRFLILKKPFDAIEVQQLARTLTNKWCLLRDIRDHTVQIEAYAKSLETVNLALEADKRIAESFAQSQSRFVLGAGKSFSRPARNLAQELASLTDSAPDTGRALDLAECLREGLDHLADLAALETGERSASTEAHEIQPILESVAAAAQERAQRRQTPLQLVQAAAIPGRAQLDGPLFTRALECALAWSIDRANEDGVTLTIGVDETRPGAMEVTFSIDFVGPRLTEEQRELLFMPFRSEESHPERVLALPLAQLAAKELGASVELDGRFDGSTRLMIRLDPGPGGGVEKVHLWPGAA